MGGATASREKVEAHAGPGSPTASFEMDYYYCPSLLKLLQYLWVSVAAGACCPLSRPCLFLADIDCWKKGPGRGGQLGWESRLGGAA